MKKLIFLLQKHCAVLTLVFLLAFVQQSCTKTNEAAEAVTTTPVNNFLTLPPGTNPELQPVVDNLQQQFQKNNFAANFLAWHGQPLWDQAIKIKSNTDDVILLIPTIKENEVKSFIEVLYNKENFFYGLHRKSSITNTIKENSNIGFDEAAVKWFMDYFDAKLGSNTTANKSNLVSPPYCWYESCTNGGGYSKTGTASANPVHDQPCWIEHCEDEGGGGGGGNDGGGTGGGGGNPGPTPNPCPVNDGWYNIIPPPPCDVPDPNGCNFTPEQAQLLLNKMVGEEKYITNTKSGGATIIQNGIIKEPKIHSWMFFSLNMMPGHKPEWSAYFKGVRFKANQNAAWKWESFSYENTAKSGGIMAPCMDADMSTIVSTLIVPDKSKVIATLYYNCKVTIPCMFGMELSDKYTNTFNDDIFAWE